MRPGNARLAPSNAGSRTQTPPGRWKARSCVVIGILRHHRQHRLHNQSTCSSPGGGWFRPALSPWSLTRLTVLTVLWVRFSPMAVILMVRVPNRPSRPKTISIPSARSGVCARRSRPASARGLFGQPHRGPSSHSIPPTFMPICKRSDALPVECVRSAMSSRTWAATGSASMMFSIASRPEIVYLINSTFNCLDIQSRTSKSF